MGRTQFILEPADRHHVGVFVHTALDQLWYSSPDAAPDGYNKPDWDNDYLGCCTKCCAPCSSLFALHAAGQLDIWVRFWPDHLRGTSWWDTERNQVDRGWLDRAWAGEDRLGCHE